MATGNELFTMEESALLTAIEPLLVKHSETFDFGKVDNKQMQSDFIEGVNLYPAAKLVPMSACVDANKTSRVILYLKEMVAYSRSLKSVIKNVYKAVKKGSTEFKKITATKDTVGDRAFQRIGACTVLI